MDLSQWLVTRRLMWRTDQYHDDVIKWKHFLRYWPFVHKGHWRGALMFSLIWAWINDWVNSRVAGDLRRRRAHCDVILMITMITWIKGNVINDAFLHWLNTDSERMKWYHSPLMVPGASIDVCVCVCVIMACLWLGWLWTGLCLFS